MSLIMLSDLRDGVSVLFFSLLLFLGGFVWQSHTEAVGYLCKAAADGAVEKYFAIKSGDPYRCCGDARAAYVFRVKRMRLIQPRE